MVKPWLWMVPALASAASATWIVLAPEEGAAPSASWISHEVPVADPVDLRDTEPTHLPPTEPTLRGRGTEPRTERPRTPEERRRAAGALAKARGWVASLRHVHGLPLVSDPAGVLATLRQAFASTSDPVVRQNLVFHAALALPGAISMPWLAELRSAPDPDVAEDALVASAFRGDPASAAAFQVLATSPSGANVHRLLATVEAHEALGESGGVEAARALRAWRAIEALDGAPYFKRTATMVPLAWQRPPEMPGERRAALSAAWLARWPGHPGSDDVALRLGEAATARGDHYEAARWYAKSAALPDQDVAIGAMERLVATAELFLSPAEIGSLVVDRELAGRQEGILEYVRLRRLAAGEGAALAVAEAARAAARAPRSRLGVGWRNRWSWAAPGGLESGLAPLAADDPLRKILPRGDDPEDEVIVERKGVAFGLRGGAWPKEGQRDRLDPHPEGVVIGHVTLACQFRAWETLAELERRASRARGADRADLLYRIAAIVYHEDPYFPAYGWPSHSFTWILRRMIRLTQDHPGTADRIRRFERETYGPVRAIEAFRRLAGEAPRWEGLDRVLFSEGLAFRRLLDYRPASAWGEDGWLVVGPDLLRSRTEGLCAAMDAVASRFPESPLADDAARASAHWRAVLGGPARR